MAIQAILGLNREVAPPVVDNEAQQNRIDANIIDAAKRTFAIIVGGALYATGVSINTVLNLHSFAPLVAAIAGTISVHQITDYLSEENLLRKMARKIAACALLYFAFFALIEVPARLITNYLLDKVSGWGMQLLDYGHGSRLSPRERERFQTLLMRPRRISATLLNAEHSVRDPIVIAGVIIFIGRFIFGGHNTVLDTILRGDSASGGILSETEVSMLQQELFEILDNDDPSSNYLDRYFLKTARKTRFLKKRASQEEGSPFLGRLNVIEELLSDYFDGKKLKHRNMSILESLKEGKASEEQLRSLKLHLNEMQYDVPEIVIPHSNLDGTEMMRLLTEKGEQLDAPLSGNADYRLRNPTFHFLHLSMLKRMVETLNEQDNESSREHWELLIALLNDGATACNDHLGNRIVEAYKMIFSEEEISTKLTFEEQVHAETRKFRDQLFEESWEQLKSETNVGDEVSSKALLRNSLQHKLGLSYEPRGASYTLGEEHLGRIEEIFRERYTMENLLDYFCEERKGQYNKTIHRIDHPKVIEYLVTMEGSIFEKEIDAWQAVYDVENDISMTRDAWMAVLASLEYPIIKPSEEF